MQITLTNHREFGILHAVRDPGSLIGYLRKSPCVLKRAITELTHKQRPIFAAEATNGDETDADPSPPKSSPPRKLLRLAVLNNSVGPIPESLLQQVIRIDPDAKIQNCWDSMIDHLAANSCTNPDVIVAIFSNRSSLMSQMREAWHLRIIHNYSPRPIFFAISTTTQSAATRFDIERAGAHFLHLFDVPKHFWAEIKQIQLELGLLTRSLPSWLIVLEGNGTTLRAIIYLVERRKLVRILASDRLIATLAGIIKHNGISRSLSAWQKVLRDDPLFKPAGGSFDVPSIGTLKMYLHRDIPNCLQRTFNEYHSGFFAHSVIERISPGTHAAQYGIRGEWEVIRC